MLKNLGIYVHIPFCVSKCVYCDFFSGLADDFTKEMYVNAVIEQINKTAPYQRADYNVVSVFFGGGTPSSLNPRLLIKILDTLKKNYNFSEDVEITVECNPGTVTTGGLLLYKDAGVNRLSFGLQSTIDADLKMLGRIHTFEDFLESYENARKHGFNNINVDLMSAIPGQSLDSWKKNLRTIVNLRPEHISAYSLIIEEGTPIYTRLEKNELTLPDEDSERDMYHVTEDILASHGYDRYEISNYARPGKECRHNILYWDRTEYIGYGAGAASFVKNQRFSIKKNLESYIDNPMDCFEDIEDVSEKEAMAEFMYLGLRMMKGVKENDFRVQFGRNINNVYGDIISNYCKSGHLSYENGIIKLTQKGIDVSNYIFADFII